MKEPTHQQLKIRLRKLKTSAKKEHMTSCEGGDSVQNQRNIYLLFFWQMIIMYNIEKIQKLNIKKNHWN